MGDGLLALLPASVGSGPGAGDGKFMRLVDEQGTVPAFPKWLWAVTLLGIWLWGAVWGRLLHKAALARGSLLRAGCVNVCGSSINR